MAKVIMIQGTMSSAGKSFITTGLCRLFHQEGYRVAPFKAQNMSSNAHELPGGLQISRAQVIQAEAAGIEPSALMNPILLKPVTNQGSEVFLHGKSLGVMPARDYYQLKPKLAAEVLSAFERLAGTVDIVVIEGAGSPAEINLRKDDLVNMGLAHLVDAPVLLVGDVDCGGVFAQLVGTMVLLDEPDRSRIKGLIVNKFRGDPALFQPGIDLLEEKAEREVFGVIPFLDVLIEEEDSLVRGHNKTKVLMNQVDRETEYDKLANALRANLNLVKLRQVMGL